MNQEKIKILVVDDDKEIVKGFAAWLEMHDYQVILAYDGRQGISEARKSKPALILMDIKMPHIDGIEACRTLKDDKETSNIPIIMVTSQSENADLKKAYASGAVDYIIKPFVLDNLDDKIKSHLKK